MLYNAIGHIRNLLFCSGLIALLVVKLKFRIQYLYQVTF